MCTARTVDSRYIDIKTSQSPALERRERCWRALVGLLCAPAGGTPGPNVQPRPGAKHESFQRLTVVNHDILSHLTNISEAQLHRSSESWPTAWACLPGCACCAGQVHGQAFLWSPAARYQCYCHMRARNRSVFTCTIKQDA